MFGIDGLVACCIVTRPSILSLTLDIWRQRCDTDFVKQFVKWLLTHEAYPPAALLEYRGDLAAQSAGERDEGILPKRPCRFTEALPLLLITDSLDEK
jgi:hypothetical protein